MREKVWVKNSRAIRKVGDRVGVGQCRLWRLTTHMEATRGYVKELGRVSG